MSNVLGGKRQGLINDLATALISTYSSHKIEELIAAIELPDKYISTENGTGAVGVSNTYDLTKVTPVKPPANFGVDDVVIFQNGYQAQVTSVDTGTDTYVAATIMQPQAVSWGMIAGSIPNQNDLNTILGTLSTIANVTSSIGAHDANNTAHSDIRALITALTTALAGKLGTGHDTDTSAHNDIRLLIAALATVLATKLDAVDWGDIGGSLASQTDLKAALDTLTTALANKVDKENGKGLSTNDFDNTYKAKLDFIGSETALSLSNMVISKQIVHVNPASNEAVTISSVAVQDAAFVIVVTAAAAITIAVPDTGSYINMSESSYTLASGDMIEIHGFYSSTDNLYHLAVLSK